MRIKNTNSNVLKRIIYIAFIINILIIFSSCAKYNKIKETNIPTKGINKDSDESTNDEPTIGVNPNWVLLKKPVLLNELLDFNWNDVSSITINKYQDSVKVVSEIIKDKQYITNIAGITSELSVVHSYNNESDDNIIYEILINQTNDVNKKKFITFGPLLEDSKYVIGGTFIESNNLNRVQYLVQTNSDITFNKIRDILERYLNLKK